MAILAQLANQIEAVLIRHPQVADQHVGARFRERLKRRGDAARCDDDSADSFKHHHQYAAGVGLVIYDEHVHAIETNQRTAVGDVYGIRDSSSPLLLAISPSSPSSPIRTARMGR